MNKLALQLFLVLAFIPIAILISSIIITLAPLYCWGLAINAYRFNNTKDCLLYTSPSPRDRTRSRMPSSA